MVGVAEGIWVCAGWSGVFSADPVAFVADQRMRSFRKGGGGVEGGSRIHTYEHDEWIWILNLKRMHLGVTF